MGFRKRNANKSDNRASAKVVMGKPASQLTKEDKKLLSARMMEIRSANGGTFHSSASSCSSVPR